MLAALACVVLFFNLMTSCLAVLCSVPLFLQLLLHLIAIRWVMLLNPVDLFNELEIKLRVSLIRTVECVGLHGEGVAQSDFEQIARLVERAHSDASQVKLDHLAFLRHARAVAFQPNFEVSGIAMLRLCAIWREV